jgi:hypothetical protein
VEEEEPTFDDDDWVPPRYIHLEDAKVIEAGTPLSAGLWRGRLAEVSGWTIVNGPS